MTAGATTRRLAELPADEAARRVGTDSIVVLPVGAFEQHGPHLPLATDLIVIEEFATAVLAEYGDALDLWLLPAIPFSKSNEHAWSPGTMWLSPETLLATMRDLGRSLAMLPARRLAILNGHGGNTGLLDVVCRELRLAHGFQTFLLHANLPPDHGGSGLDEELGQGVHGGVSETSTLLHLRPDLVHLELAAPHAPAWLDTYPHLRFGGDTAFGWLSDDFGPSGVIGDPTLATAERGKHAFEAGVCHLGEVLREIAAFRFGEPFTPPA
jgi:creatinine amidohydrolase